MCRPLKSLSEYGTQSKFVLLLGTIHTCIGLCVCFARTCANSIFLGSSNLICLHLKDWSDADLAGWRRYCLSKTTGSMLHVNHCYLEFYLGVCVLDLGPHCRF